MVFISNIWYPMDGAPAWIQDVSKALPLRPLADGLQAAFDPRYGGTGILWRDLLPLLAWTVVGCVLMSRTLMTLASRDLVACDERRSRDVPDVPSRPARSRSSRPAGSSPGASR